MPRCTREKRTREKRRGEGCRDDIRNRHTHRCRCGLRRARVNKGGGAAAAENLRLASALQSSGAGAVLCPRSGARDFPAQQCGRHRRQQPPQSWHADAVEAKAPGLWVAPFIRPYRVQSDVQTWSEDPAIFAMIEEEFKRGYYRGVGEFHIFGQAAQRPLVRKTVDFATERGLFVLAHCDEEA